ncbi:hypothetical protein FQR65_LT04395 [Abscondita terminalis]|nr:hypothetical protein FQR65_LT04395 [Abscondita terminalis]
MKIKFFLYFSSIFMVCTTKSKALQSESDSVDDGVEPRGLFYESDTSSSTSSAKTSSTYLNIDDSNYPSYTPYIPSYPINYPRVYSPLYSQSYFPPYYYPNNYYSDQISNYLNNQNIGDISSQQFPESQTAVLSYEQIFPHLTRRINYPSWNLNGNICRYFNLCGSPLLK